MAIEGYGTIIIHARTPSGDEALITLHDMVFVPGYHTSLISYYTLNEKSGAYLDAKNLLIRTSDDVLFCTLTRLYRQFVLEYNEPSVFATVKSTERPKATGTGFQWHHRLSHTGPEVIITRGRDQVMR